MAEYYMILTLAGQAAYAQAGAGGSAVQISAVAIGDGGGVAVQPAESWTALAREVWRSAPALVEVDVDNPRLVLIETHVPYNVGGWYVREVGLLSSEGVLLAVGNYPESYKPALESSGVGKELMIRVYIEHSNASQTVLSINPDIVMASCSYVVTSVATHDASPTAHAGQLGELTAHLADLANPHQVTAAQVGAEPAGAVAEHDVSPAAHADQFAGLTAHLADLANPHQVTADQAGAETAGAVAEHNTDDEAHADIRALIAGLAAQEAAIEEGFIGGGSMWGTLTNGATPGTIADAANNLARAAMLFPGSGNDTSAEFDFCLPSNWDRGTVKAKVVFAPGAGASVGKTVGFTLAGVAIGDGDALDAAPGAAVQMNKTLANLNMQTTAASAALTIAGNPQAGDLLRFKLTRDYDYGASPLTVDAQVLGVFLQYGVSGAVSAW
jgi:phage-related tail fiber protein